MEAISQLLTQDRISIEEWQAILVTHLISSPSTDSPLDLTAPISQPSTTAIATVSTASTSDLPSVPFSAMTAPAAGGMEGVQQMGSAAVMEVPSIDPPVKTKLTTSVKLMDVLATYLAPKRKQVTLMVGDEDKGDADSREVQSSADVMDIDGKTSKKNYEGSKMKRRQIISSR
jgi:hypothetical protein